MPFAFDYAVRLSMRWMWQEGASRLLCHKALMWKRMPHPFASVYTSHIRVCLSREYIFAGSSNFWYYSQYVREGVCVHLAAAAAAVTGWAYICRNVEPTDGHRAAGVLRGAAQRIAACPMRQVVQDTRVRSLLGAQASHTANGGRQCATT